MIVDDRGVTIDNCYQKLNIRLVATAIGATVTNYTVCLVDRADLENYNVQAACINRVNANIDIDLVVVSSDHAYHGDISPQIAQFDKPVVIFSNSPQDSSATMLYALMYPYWAIAYPMHAQVNCDKRNISFQKTYLYSCLNYHPHDFRVANLVKFHQSSYWDQTLITFLDVIDFWATALYPCDYLNHERSSMIDHYVDGGKQYFVEHMVKLLPLTHPDTALSVRSDNLMRYDNPAYMDTYVNVVTESDINITFLSEKILKSICAEQFFVVIGGKHIVQHLRSHGFDVYDDIIDHDRYDTQLHPQDRLHHVHELLEELKDLDWASVYQQTVDRRQQNRELLLSGQICNRFCHDLSNTINTIVRS
jgi:hypothetical protein